MEDRTTSVWSGLGPFLMILFATVLIMIKIEETWIGKSCNLLILTPIFLSFESFFILSAFKQNEFLKFKTDLKMNELILHIFFFDFCHHKNVRTKSSLNPVIKFKYISMKFKIISFFLHSDLEFEPFHRIELSGADVIAVRDGFNDDLIKLKQIKFNKLKKL